MALEIRPINIYNIPTGASTRIIAVPFGYDAVALEVRPGRLDVVVTGVDYWLGTSQGIQLVGVSFDSAEAGDANLVGTLTLSLEPVATGAGVVSNRNYDSGE